jgi:beta-lactamase superfamily II metal-dependent hydrolase
MFIYQIRSNTVIFTVGYHNPFGHSKFEVVERYKAFGRTIYRLHFDGTLTLDFDACVITAPPYCAKHPCNWQATAVHTSTEISVPLL